jgi:hypothetical protein
MSVLKTAVLAAAVTVILTTGWFYREYGERLQEAERLRTENDRMRLLASRRHEAWLQQAQRVRGSEYRNEGQSTPSRALQTYAWACDHGDVVLMEGLIVFDAAARKRAEDYFAARPQANRAQWASLDALAAALHVEEGMSRPWPAAAVLEQAGFEPAGPDRVVVVLPGTKADRSEFLRTPTGWKLVITRAAVDAHIQKEDKEARFSRRP